MVEYHSVRRKNEFLFICNNIHQEDTMLGKRSQTQKCKNSKLSFTYRNEEEKSTQKQILIARCEEGYRER